MHPDIQVGKIVYARFELLGIEEPDAGAVGLLRADGPRAVCVCVDKDGGWLDRTRIYLRPEALAPSSIVKAEIQAGKDKA